MWHFIFFKISVSNILFNLNKNFSSAVLVEYVDGVVAAQLKPRSFVSQVPSHV